MPARRRRPRPRRGISSARPSRSSILVRPDSATRPFASESISGLISSAVTLPVAPTKVAASIAREASSCSKIKNLFARFQTGAPNYSPYNGSKSGIDLAKIELRDAVPNTDLPLKRFLLGCGFHKSFPSTSRNSAR